MKKIEKYLFVFFTVLMTSCHSKKKQNTDDTSQQKQLIGIVQSSEISYVSPPKSPSFLYSIKDLVEEGHIVKKGDYIAELSVQKNHNDNLTQKQSVDRLIQEKAKQTDEIQALIQKNINDIHKNEADIDIKNRSKTSTKNLAEYIPLNTIKKDEIDNKISLISVNNLKLQNKYYEQQMKIYKENYEKRLALLQNNLLAPNENQKIIIKADADGMLFLLKNWHQEKYTKGSDAYADVSFARIENTQKIQIMSYLPEEDRDLVAIGKQVQVTIFGPENFQVEGKINSISKIVMSLKNWGPSLDSSKPTSTDPMYFQMAVSLTTIPPGLKPGTQAQVIF